MAGDDWVTRELEMGHRSNVSRALSAFRSESSRPSRRLKRKLYARTDPLRLGFLFRLASVLNTHFGRVVLPVGERFGILSPSKTKNSRIARVTF